MMNDVKAPQLFQSVLRSDLALLFCLCDAVKVQYPPPSTRMKEGFAELTYLPGGLEERDSCMFPFSIL